MATASEGRRLVRSTSQVRTTFGVMLLICCGSGASNRVAAQSEDSPPSPSRGPDPGAGDSYSALGTQEPEIEPGAWDPWAYPYSKTHQHDGFYLRLSVGIGGGVISGDGHVASGVDEVALSSFGIGSSIGLGFALIPNLILHLDLSFASFFNSDVDVDGDDQGAAAYADPGLGVGEDQQLVGLGIGMTYYFMPANIYLSGSLGIGRVVFEDDDGDRGASSVGLAGNLMLGKEWWVANDWGIGIAAQLLLLSVEDDLLNDVNAAALSVLFSASYN
jgi:hypothetical protein